jgi:hypothetical protein
MLTKRATGLSDGGGEGGGEGAAQMALPRGRGRKLGLLYTIVNITERARSFPFRESWFKVTVLWGSSRMMGYKSLAVLCVVGVAFLSSCGAKKELFPERPAESLPEMPVREKAKEDPGTQIIKKKDLLLTHQTESFHPNQMTMASGAELYRVIEQRFHLPIQFDGYLMLSNVSHSFQHCNGNIPEPKFYLEDDLNGRVEMAPDVKVNVVQKKLYSVRVVYQNTGACAGFDIQFSVLYGE